jgi:hypothetical protein
VARRKAGHGLDGHETDAGDEPAQARARQEIETVWRLEAPKLIAALTRIIRDLSAAEDLAQDALVAALRQWPEQGLPPESGRVVDGGRQAPGNRPDPPPRARRTKTGGAGTGGGHSY